jgi:glycosyltransferase involved in cell wall biosynthesis
LLHFAHGFFAPLLTLGKRQWRKRPVIWTIFNVPPEEHSLGTTPWDDRLRPFKERARDKIAEEYAHFILKFAKYDRLVCVSKATEDKVIGSGGDSNKTLVIPIGVESRFLEKRAKTDAREILGLPLDRRIVLTVAGIIPHKGLHVLIDAIPDIVRFAHDVLFVVVGPTRDRSFQERLAQRVTQLPHPDCLRLVGEVSPDALPFYYAAADLYVQPSLQEGFGISMLEAMASGVPVVATHTGIVPELADIQGVRSIPPGHPNSLRDAVLALLGSTENLETLGRLNRLVVERSFTWDRVTQRLASLYAEISVG